MNSVGADVSDYKNLRDVEWSNLRRAVERKLAVVKANQDRPPDQQQQVKPFSQTEEIVADILGKGTRVFCVDTQFLMKFLEDDRLNQLHEKFMYSSRTTSRTSSYLVRSMRVISAQAYFLLDVIVAILVTLEYCIGCTYFVK